MPDYRDLALEHLALDELDALDTAATWREVAGAAIDRLAEQYVELTRLREQHHRLIDEFRQAREELRRFTRAQIDEAA